MSEDRRIQETLDALMEGVLFLSTKVEKMSTQGDAVTAVVASIKTDIGLLGTALTTALADLATALDNAGVTDPQVAQAITDMGVVDGQLQAFTTEVKAADPGAPVAAS